ncbi:MAG: hypothetical protein J6P84_05960, partial [Alphaproteobacteria bacterium]|nr:hypothetical protein [Alphaproteobacteria bacterium]
MKRKCIFFTLVELIIVIVDESKCIDALETLGLLTHMWQDYYAHGVERDDSWFGAQVGTLRGSPD